MTDFTHGDEANAKREAKAATLTGYLLGLGFDRVEAAGFVEPARRQMEREAGVNKASGETWDLVLAALPIPPPEPSSVEIAKTGLSVTAPPAGDLMPEGERCRYWTAADGWCGVSDDVHPYTYGSRCDRHARTWFTRLA